MDPLVYQEILAYAREIDPQLAEALLDDDNYTGGVHPLAKPSRVNVLKLGRAIGCRSHQIARYRFAKFQKLMKEKFLEEE